jgi:hypothetical protein
MDTIPIWVRLPGLPPQYWSEKCFQVIGNELGNFIKADMSFKEIGEMVLPEFLSPSISGLVYKNNSK